MSLAGFASSPRFMRLSMVFSRRTPRRVVPPFAWGAADIISRLKPAAYRTVQTNLGQVLGVADHSLLDRTARQVFYHFIRAYYDLFRAVQLPREELLRSVLVPESAQAAIRSARATGRGIVIVSAHLGNFDMAGQIMPAYIPNIQLISLPNPPAGFVWFNELRRRSGAEITPASPGALRQALRALKQGQAVAIGADRPISDLDRPVPFFGRPARMPSAHVRLALKTGATILVSYCVFVRELGQYVLHVEPPLEMVRVDDREEEERFNMRRVLDMVEEAIRRWPEQWNMFVPVWPDLLPAGPPAAG